MTEGRLETESRCQECLAIIKGEVTSNNLSKRRVRTRTHGVVGGRGLVAPSYPIVLTAPYNLHKTKFPDRGMFERYVFYFGREMIQDFAGGFHAFTKDFSQDTAIIFEISSVMEQKLRAILAPYDPVRMTQTELKLIFLLILNTILEGADQCKVTRFHEQSPYVCRLLEYMCEQYDEPMTLDS